MQKPYQDLKSRNDSFKASKEERTPHGPVPDYLNMPTRNNIPGGRISNSGPLMSKKNMAKANIAKSTMYVKENAPPRYIPPARVNPKMLSGSGSVSSKSLLDLQDQQVMNQRRDRRAYNRSDTLDSRHMTTPIDPCWVSYSNDLCFVSFCSSWDYLLTVLCFSVYSIILVIARFTCRDL